MTNKHFYTATRVLLLQDISTWSRGGHGSGVDSSKILRFFRSRSQKFM